MKLIYCLFAVTPILWLPQPARADSTNCLPAPGGLVSWWSAESNTTDVVGGNNGTLAGGASFGAGEVGQAFSFDGAGEVSVSSTAALNVQSVTFEAWVNPSVVDHDVDIILNKENNPVNTLSDISYELGVRGAVNAGIGSIPVGHLAFFLGGIGGLPDEYGGGWVDGGAAVPTNRWTHCALAFDGTAVRVYINGALTRSIGGLSGTMNSTTGPFKIGSRSSAVISSAPAYRFNGLIDEVSVYNRALSGAEIQSIYTASSAGKCPASVSNCVASPSGLVSWWQAEQNALDFAAGNNGTLAGNVAYGTGRVGQSFVFDGYGDAVDLGNPTNLQSQNFTIEAWVKRTSATSCTQDPAYNTPGPPFYAVGALVCYGNDGYGFLMLGDGRLDLAKTGVGAVFSSSVRVTDTNNYHHVAVTKSGSSVVFYVDGVAESMTFSETFAFTTPVAIGARGSDLAHSFWGSIDEMAVYNRALAAAEIQEVYQAGGAGKCTGPSPPVIITQPANQTAFVGESPTIEVKALGTPLLAYQWRFNGTNILGATNLALALFNAQFTNAGSYSVVVTNLYGSATSSNALLTVNPASPCTPPPPGLVSWWRAEGNSLDADAGNNGDLLGNATYGQGRVGQAFVLDGSGDAVLVGNPTNLQLQNFTIEAWIQRANTSVASFTFGGGLIFGYGHGGYALGMLDDGSLFLTKVGIDNVILSTAIADTNVHHLAVTKSGSTVFFYIDGVAYSVPSYVTSYEFFTPAAIGARGDNYSGSFFGRIDEVAIYGRALVAVEIQAIYNANLSGKCDGPAAPVIIVQPANQTGFVSETVTFDLTVLGTFPLAYQWQFNGTNIQGATNSALSLFNTQFTNAGNYSVIITNPYGSAISSNAVVTVSPTPPCTRPAAGLISWWRGEGNALDHTGANNGSLANNTSYAPGKTGQAFMFDGNTDGVQLENPANLQLQDFTIEAWVRRASTIRGTQDPAYTHGALLHYGNNGYALNLLADGRLEFGKVGVGAVQSSSVTVTDTNFHHVAVTKSGNNLVFYVDGFSENTIFNGTFSFTTPVAIGARGSDLAHSFWGSIDEMAVYNRALSTNEIQSISNARQSGKCIVPVPPAIVSHPRNTNVIAGANATLMVVAGGSEPLSYQWRFNGTNIIGGATNSELTLTNIQFSHVGIYSVQITNVAGSVLSSNASLTVTFPPATIRALNTNAMAGALVTVPVTLAANGDENTFGFSLSFNSQRLTFAGVTWGNSVSGATVLLNTNQASLGRLGFSVTFPPEMAFAAGTQEVVRIHFNSLPLLGFSPVNAINSFGDQPVLRELYNPQLQVISANYSSGNVTLTPTVFEADVFPRPNGNQAVTTTDWSQASRFAARLDTAAAGAEFQRADCAPRATLGDGQMKVTDWVQAGRYLAALDPLAAIGGPTNEVALGAGIPSASRQVRVASTNVPQGQNTQLSVILEAQGNENALGFTLAFNPTAFTFASVTLGSGASGASLIPNTSQVAAGRLGVVLALPTGSSFSAGSRELIQASFIAAPDVAETFPITLTDQSVTRCVSDALANELPVSYVNGTVAVNPSNPNPSLDIARSSNNVVLSRPLWAADFFLQTLEGSNGVQGTWTNTPGALQTNGSTVFITLPIATESKFFRLFRP